MTDRCERLRFVKILNQVFEPTDNKIASRIAFWRIHQTSDESLLDYEARLRKASSDYKWTGDELQLSLIEQFFVGLEDNQVKQAALIKCTKHAKLEEVFEFACDIVRARKTVADTAASSSIGVSVNSVKHRAPKSSKKNASKGKTKACYRCGDKSHLAPNCKYQSVKCNGWEKSDICEKCVRKTVDKQIIWR